jgi:hypothetical protein
MPQVLTTNAQIVCPHGGLGTTLNTSTHWTVNGGYVARDGDQGILSCIFIPPCASYILQSMGLNAVQLDGRKVMLVTDFTKSITGLPLVITEIHKVLDDSTPAPLPSGQPAPPLPPNMADTTPPVVQLTVPPLDFHTLVTPPVPVTATFSLSATYPLQWILWLIHKGVPAGNVELTQGIPGMALVSPPGGTWDSPTLTINVTLQGAFVATFPPGEHQLYLTGITQRGLSAFAKASFQVGP